MADDPLDQDSASPFEISRELDLHTFRPRDIASVVEEYLAEAHERGFQHVRLIHGKGIGFQREVVRTILARTPFVVSFRDDYQGNRGATWAELKPTQT